VHKNPQITETDIHSDLRSWVSTLSGPDSGRGGKGDWSAWRECDCSVGTTGQRSVVFLFLHRCSDRVAWIGVCTLDRVC